MGSSCGGSGDPPQGSPSRRVDQQAAEPTASRLKGGGGITRAMLAMLLASLTLAGCATVGAAGSGGIAGVLAHLKPMEKRCHGPLNGLFDFDFSGSDRGDDALLASRMQELRGLADQVAACGGDIQAAAFSSSAADAAMLGEARFPRGSGTDTARLIRANRTVDAFLAQVKGSIPTVLWQVSPAGTDVLSQLKLGQQLQQQNEGGTLDIEIATDGISTAGPVYMDTPEFTTRVAEAAASRVPVPSLPGARVLFVGIGKTAGPGFGHLSSGHVDALVAFYETVCQRTDASYCLITTSVTSEGGA